MVHGIIQNDLVAILLVLGYEVMIKRDRRGHPYCVVRGEILGSTQDEQLRRHFGQNAFINQERKSEVRRRSDTALVLTINDAN